MTPKMIVPAGTTHIVEAEEYGTGDSRYRVSFRIDDSFREAKSHAAEVTMLSTYAPDSEYGTEGDMPYIAVQEDDDVYGGTALFMETGRVDAASEVTPLTGRFLFRAKMEYYGDLMYFYGFTRFGDEYQPCGLCLVYPRELEGTENERTLMRILDDAAGSYEEELIGGSPDNSVQETIPPAPEKNIITQDKTLQTVVKTAAIIKRVRLIAGLAIIAGILIFLVTGKIADSLSKHHIVAISDKVDIISQFTPEEQNMILDAFGVVIPAGETDACIASFMRNNRFEDLDSYVIEIDGVKDYAAFFAANAEHTSLNEFPPREGHKPEYYYITYSAARYSALSVTSELTEIEQLFETLYRK